MNSEEDEDLKTLRGSSNGKGCLEMLKLGTMSKLSTEAVITRAVQYFGPGGCELEVKDQSPCCVTFEGAGGRVEVNLTSTKAGTSVEVLSQEWDHQTKEFVDGLAR